MYQSIIFNQSIHDFMNPWIHESMVSWIYETMDSWIHASMNSSFHPSINPGFHQSFNSSIHQHIKPLPSFSSLSLSSLSLGLHRRAFLAVALRTEGDRMGDFCRSDALSPSFSCFFFGLEGDTDAFVKGPIVVVVPWRTIATARSNGRPCTNFCQKCKARSTSSNR